MDDLLSVSEEYRLRQRRRVMVVVLVLYFAGLFVYTIHISQQRMPFFTRIAGYDSYEQGGQLTWRVSAVGTREQTPLYNIRARLDLLQPAAGMEHTLFQGASGDRNYLDVTASLPELPAGDYLARLTVSHPEYGEEVNETRLTITTRRPPRAVDVQRLDERQNQRARAAGFNELSQPLEITLLPNNGRFVPNVNNHVLLVAESLPERLPVRGLKVEVAAAGKAIASLVTDAMGHATFNYYPHTLGGERLRLTATETGGKSQSADAELRPFGSQVVARPRDYFLPAGTPLRLRVEALNEGIWNIDLIHYGNWLATLRQEMSGAAALVDIPVPATVTGPLQVQIAKGVEPPNTAYEVVQVFYYDPAEAVISPDDPRLVNAEPDPEMLERIKLEKPFTKLWNYVGSSSGFGQSLVENWQKKLNAMGLKRIPFDPKAMSEEILRKINKDFVMLPELLNTAESRQRNFAAQQRNKRDNALILLAISGLIVVGMMSFRIWRELQSRRDLDTGIETGGKHIAGLVFLFVIIIVAYAAMLYLMSMLDWWKGM